MRTDAGSILVFLPGAAEIRRCETQLRERVSDPAIDIVPLFGALEADVQDRAIAPAPPGRRKVVLATSIAETSLTIEGVRIVVDSGLARVPRYEPDVGLTRLETVRVSRAAADQRRGRAGRTAPGICYRLWEEAQTGALEAFARPEILAADLSGLVLDLAQWGVTEPDTLAFLDPPPRPALSEARALLRELGAIDADRSDHRRGPQAARAAAAAAARPHGGRCRRAGRRPARGRRSRSSSPSAGLAATTPISATGSTSCAAIARAVPRKHGAWRGVGPRSVPERSADQATQCQVPARSSRLAYPDRIAKNRGDGRFLLANGRGADRRAEHRRSRVSRSWLWPRSPAARPSGRIVLAAPISLAEIEAEFADQIETRERSTFEPAKRRACAAARSRALGAIALAGAAGPGRCR